MMHTIQFLHYEQWEQGVAMFAPMPGPWHSSNSRELAGLIMAAQASLPIHVGIDNKAVVDKATQLIEIARGMSEEERAQKKKPNKTILY